MPNSRSSRWGSRSACLRIALVCLLPVLLAVCGEDGASGPSGPPIVGRLEFTSGPILSGGFLGPNLPIDRVHVVIVRPPSAVVRDTTRPFDPNQNQLRLDLPILLRAAAESLDVTLELLSGSTVLFSGTSRLEAHSGPPSTTPPPAIPLIYSGPGSQIAQLQIAPLDSTLDQGDSLIMRVSGLDAGALPVTAFYVGWSSSDSAIARVNGAGVVRGRVPRGTVYIRARTPDTQAFPSGIIESTTVTLVPSPATLIKVAGDNQTAAVGTALPQLLAVEVRAADNLPVAGATVTFATTSPGATVDSATATSDASGIARTGVILGTTVGPQTFTATAAGAPAVSFTANATLTPAPTWTGAVSFDWNDAGNWNTGIVPGAGDSVTIPSGTPNTPDLTSNVGIGALLNNSVVNLGDFGMTVAGNLRGSGAISGTSVSNLFIAAPGTIVDHATVTNLVVFGSSVTISRNMSVSGKLTIQNNGNLTVGGQTVSVNGDLATLLGGTLTMTSSADVLTILGNATFNGGDETGKLVAGLLNVEDDFTQLNSSSPASFLGSGNHSVQSIGNTVQNITFATPASSRFQNIIVGNTVGGSTMGSDFTIAGVAAFANANVPRIIHGSGHTLTMLNLRMDLLTLDNLLVVGGPAITQFDRVTFANTPATATAVTINHPGAATSFVFTDLVFQVTPTTGKYMSVTDNLADANVLTIDLVNPNPGTPGGFLQTAGGAVVNWPFVPAGARTWTGAVSTDWFTAGNWSPAAVPVATDDVIIPATAQQPVFNAPVAVHDLTVQTGATLTGGFDLTASGNVSVSGSFVGGTIVLVTNGSTVSGNIDFLRVVLATRFESVFVSGPVAVTNLLDVERGHLDVGANTVTAGTFQTNNEGMLKMVNPAGTLIVNGEAVFSGEDPTGVLTAGTIRIRGNFVQLTVVTQGSFVSSGTNRVILDGTGQQFVSFQNPGPSHFQDLEIANTSDTVFMLTDITVSGQLIEQAVGPVVLQGVAQTLTANGISMSGVTFDNLRLSLLTGTITQFDNVTWIGLPTFVTQFTVTRPTGTFAFSNHTFATTPSTGFYLRADDTNPSDGQVLTVSMVNPTPATPGAFVQTAGGAVVNWPIGGGAGAIIWTGAVSTDWSATGNWSGNVVPTITDSVEIPAATNQPTLTTTSFARAIHLANGTLTLGGQGMVVATTFATTGSGRLVMTLPTDGMTIGGNAIFNGASELGFMTDGGITFTGNLTQLATNSPDSYHPSGTHTTLFTGNNQTITFATPGLVPGSSHFQQVVWGGTGTLTLGSQVLAHGDFFVTTGSVTTIQGSGVSLGVGGFATVGQSLTFDGVALQITQTVAGTVSLNNISLVNQNPAGTQLTIHHPGTSGAIVTSNLSFSTVPTTGFYLLADDNNVGDGLTLTVDMQNPTPGTAAGFIQTVGGAVVNWPAAGGGSATWNGSVSTDWNDPANWNGNQVPAAGADVIIPAGALNFPALISSEVVGNLIVEPIASIDFVDGTLEVTGDLTGGGSMLNGGPFMSGSGKSIQMSDVGSLLIGGFITLASNLQVGGDLVIQGAAAHFDVNGFALNVLNDLVLTTSGTIQMTNPAGVLNVTGNAIFDGGPETGLLTAGTLVIQGNFTQLNSSTQQSFRANGMLTILNGNSLQTITMADSLLSFFDDLQLSSTGGVQMASMARVIGNLDIGTGVSVTAVDQSFIGGGFDVGGNVNTGSGSSLATGRLYVAGALSVGGTWNQTSVIFTGTGQTAPSTLPYQFLYSRGAVTFAAGTPTVGTLTVEAGTLTLAGRTTVTGDVFIADGTLKPNNRTLTVGGALNVQTTGTLTMQNALDSVLVTGFAGFGGASSVGLMTNGVLRVGGSFTQTSGTSNTSFAASGSHKTILGSAAIRVVNFATPGTGLSKFGRLDVSGASGGLTLSNNIVADTLISHPGGIALRPQFNGGASARSVTVMSLNVDSLVFDNAPLIVNEQGTIRSQLFDRGIFQGFPTTATSAVLIDFTGVGTSVTQRQVQFNTTTLQTSLGSGGLYVRVTSSNALGLRLTMAGSNDPTGGFSRSQALNGAQIQYQ
jgi:fibronectin-binding autotransporter adhesin